MAEPKEKDDRSGLSRDEFEQRLNRLEHIRQTDLMREKVSDNEQSQSRLENVWADYVVRVRSGDRKSALRLLNLFSDFLALAHPDDQDDWVQRILSQERELLKYPLFEKVVFPRLKDGVLQGRRHSARQLAGCERLMTASLLLQLPEGAQTSLQLLALALQHDPTDDKALRHWAEAKARFLVMSLHEIPSGVLWDGVRGATAEECGELLEDLEDFERRVPLALRERYADTIAKARFYYSAYQAHLSCPTGESFACRLTGGTWGQAP